MSNLIDRQAAIKAIKDIIGTGASFKAWAILDAIMKMPTAQPEITDEQAIEHLRSTGWMQNHDREMYDMGLKEQLADDSGSYDSLLPSAQPEPQWIPCSERLPEEDQYNLVTMQHANGEIDVVIARLVKPYSQNVPWEWESDDAEWTWSFKNGFAWMPLPSPYQAERRTDE